MGAQEIYPGSNNVDLEVVVKYTGSSDIEAVAGCLEDLPAGFTPSLGYSGCSPAYMLNGSTYATVKPGSTVLFRYKLDIARDVAPGTYMLGLKISYVNSSTGESATYTLWLPITVSMYPRPQLEVIETYWEPAGYPGSSGVTLVIVLRNSGDVDVSSGTVKLRLPQWFAPQEATLQLQPVPRNSYVEIRVSGISISPGTEPGRVYYGYLEADVTAVTRDGVSYTAQIAATFTLEVEEPPQVELEVLDYGVAASTPALNTTGTRLYVTLQLASPDIEVRGIVANFVIEEGAVFANGSRYSISYYPGPYSYGDVVTLVSDSLVASGSVRFRLELEVLGVRDGAEFWQKLSYKFNVNLREPNLRLSVAAIYWDGGVAYPGSEDETLTVILENNGLDDVEALTATLLLSNGFTPYRVAVSGITVPSGSQAKLSFHGISIGAGVEPGYYPATLVLVGTARNSDGSFYGFNISLKLLIPVEEYGVKPYRLVSYGWVGGNGYTTTRNGAIEVELQVSEPITVRSTIVRAILPPGLEAANLLELNKTISGPAAYGETISLVFRGISVVDDEKAVPVILEVEGLASINGVEAWYRQYFTMVLPVQEPELKIELLDYGWSAGYASVNASGVELLLVMRSEHIGVIRSLNATLHLRGARFLGGYSSDTVSVNGPISYGQVFTLRFTGIEVEDENITAVLTVYAIVESDEGYYVARGRYTFSLGAEQHLPMLVISGVEYRYGGQPAPVIPGQEDLEITVELINTKPYVVSAVSVNPRLPAGFKLKLIEGTCQAGVAPGDSCNIRLIVDVDTAVAPGSYPASLALVYYVNSDGAVLQFSDELSFTINVVPLEAVAPRLELLSTYWGTAPSIAYAGAGVTQLTVAIYNPGRYSVEGVYVEFKPLNSSVDVVRGTSYCSPSLAPGASCTAQIHLSLERVDPGVIRGVVIVRYLVRVYGVNSIVERNFTVDLPVASFGGREGLLLIDAGWLNNWHVYPETDNATLVITLANGWPFPISGILLELQLPEGFTGSNGTVAVAYVDGPIPSLSSFQAHFTIGVGNVEPGRYTARLIARYIVDVTGASIERREAYNVTLRVSNPASDVEFVSAYWVGGSPEPDTKGAILMLVFRNNGFAEMRGATLLINLPDGARCAINNETAARLPIGYQLQGQPATMPVVASELEDIARLVGVLQQTSQNIGVITAGSLVEARLPLNLYLREPGTLKINVTLDFIDHWGSRRRVNFSVEVPVLGSARLVEVYLPERLSISEGKAAANMTVVNVGTSTLYNVYVYIVPRIPLLLPATTTLYIDELRPGEPKSFSIEFNYNPAGLAYYYGGEGGDYAAVPIVFTVVYRDVTGYMHIFNATRVVRLEPFIDIRLGSDVKAEARSGELIVGGSIANYGISKARSVAVIVETSYASAMSFVGDIDPAGQSAFRVDLPLKGPTPSTVNLTIMYRDNYGKTWSKTVQLPVQITEVNVTTTVQPETGHNRGYIVVSLVVAAFLAVATFIIYRFLKRHEAKLQGA
ncbi:hypothetical protein Hbut_0901 [Hyperthermus butylicus DSM 5456]|uniref:Alpha-galactosidase NEW3 domain-containing protein n=1 Tax=Hyperthermus butylicus (strain DSM 5456 / JCM 9403 / PLM1-5) TaxID=415426 RepID=A2BL89_HYPBU|nr:hypothetical protein Hbut_0901 [Hyperthermus butylicus DSM 5456]